MRGLVLADEELAILPLSVYDELNTEFFKVIHHKCAYTYDVNETQFAKETRETSEGRGNSETDLAKDIAPQALHKKSKRKGRNVSLNSSNQEEPGVSTLTDIDKSSPKRTRKSSRQLSPQFEGNSDEEESGNLRSDCESGEQNVDEEQNSETEADSDYSPITATKKLKYTCDKCDETFSKEFELTKHKKSHETLTNKTSYKCQVCETSFKDKKTLLKHEKTVHKDSSDSQFKQGSSSRKKSEKRLRFQCVFCGYRCKTKTSLKLHERSHTNERPFSCEHCDMKFRLKHHLTNHLLIHTGEKSYLCSTCGKKSRQLAHHLKHLTLHKSSYKLGCDICGKIFKKLNVLESHKYREHQGGNRTYRCNECDTVFQTVAEYQKHRTTVHRKKSLQCEICGLSCACMAVLKVHLRTHTGEKPFKCTLCDYACNLKSQLTQHERLHTGEKPYQCDTCGKAFRLKNHLKIHNNIHLGVRPFKCDQCSSTFRQFAHLQLHKQTHTKKPLYSCEECGVSFKLKRELDKHKSNLHPNETGPALALQPKPFKCNSCDASFAQHSYLKQHELSHIDERPFKCDRCPSTFRTKASWRRHDLVHRETNEIRPDPSQPNAAESQIFATVAEEASPTGFMNVLSVDTAPATYANQGISVYNPNLDALQNATHFNINNFQNYLHDN